MGLSNAISGGIMLFTLIYMISIIPNILGDSMSVNNAMLDRNEMDNSLVKTSLKVDSITKLSNEKIELVVNNTGLTKLAMYDEFSLVVTYDGNNTNGILPPALCAGIENLCQTYERVRVSEQLTYGGVGMSAEATMSRGSWVLYSFDPEFDSEIDPQIVNPEEEFKIRLRLSGNLWDDSNNDALIYCSIMTGNGVTTSKGVFA